MNNQNEICIGRRVTVVGSNHPNALHGDNGVAVIEGRIMSKPTEQQVFEYLDELRESGVTNMHGSPAYVEKMFDISWKRASVLVGKWMKTFSEQTPVITKDGS